MRPQIQSRLYVMLPLLLVLFTAWLCTPTTLHAHESDDPNHPPHVTFAIDESLTPIKGESLKIDGQEHPLATLTDDSGHQTDFLADTLLVASTDPNAIADFLQRWEGEILTEAKAAGTTGEKEKAIRYAIRINRDLADLELIDKYAERLHGNGHYRVSNKGGLQLLAAAISEYGLGKVDVAMRWIDFQDAVTPTTIKEIKPLRTALEINCGYALMQHLRLLRDVVEGGPRGIMAEQQLTGIVADMSECNPPTPTFNLNTNSVTELPIADAGEPLGLYILNPPSYVPNGFHAEIINAVGSFTSHSLYGGSVRMNYDQSQIGLATQPTFDLPRCAHSETFTLRLTHGNRQWDFTVRQPVRLAILGNHTYSLVPGSNVNIQLCAAGEPDAMNWQWIAESGDAFPPAALTGLQEDSTGNASITGVINTSNYYSVGRLQVTQGGNSASVPASLSARVNFHPDLRPCPPVAYLTPGEYFECELSRPMGYDSYTWSEIAGALPTGLQLISRNIRWYIEGTVATTTPSGNSPVGHYDVTYRLRGNNLTLGTRELTFNIGIPFNAWAQNMIMRPNNPFVPNTGDDNEERTDMLVSRINTGRYDIVALQEFFDDDQREQLALGINWQQYDLLWGPTDEKGLFGEESGLGLLVDDSFGGGSGSIPRGQNGHYTEIFEECEGNLQDCLANKGFSVTQVHIGPNEYIYVVNTHLQAGYDHPEQHSGVRVTQLRQIMNYLSDPVFATHPVLLLGDLNIAAGNGEYNQRMAANDLLDGWIDVTTLVSGVNGPTEPFTNDKTTNAYGHFWSSDGGVNHTLVHLLEHVARAQGENACNSLAQSLAAPTSICRFSFPHPNTQNRLDYIMVRQGSQYQLTVSGVEMVDRSPRTALCQTDFYMADHPGMNCFFSDHYGLAADLRLERMASVGNLGLEREPATTTTEIFLPMVSR